MRSLRLTIVVMFVGFLAIGAFSADVIADDQGLTPGYWKNHPQIWALTGYGLEDPFNDVFDVNTLNTAFDLTLLDVLYLNGGGVNALGRHAVAALLNASHPGIQYPYDAGEVLAIVSNLLNQDIQLLSNQETAEEAIEIWQEEIESWKDEFEYWNEISYHPAD